MLGDGGGDPDLGDGDDLGDGEDDLDLGDGEDDLDSETDSRTCFERRDAGGHAARKRIYAKMRGWSGFVRFKVLRFSLSPNTCFLNQYLSEVKQSRKRREVSREMLSRSLSRRNSSYLLVDRVDFS